MATEGARPPATSPLLYEFGNVNVTGLLKSIEKEMIRLKAVPYWPDHICRDTVTMVTKHGKGIM
jgi:hypothetical protein